MTQRRLAACLATWYHCNAVLLVCPGWLGPPGPRISRATSRRRCWTCTLSTNLVPLQHGHAGVPRVARAAGPAHEPGYEPPTLLDLQFIVRFSEDCAPDQLRCLVHSLCPAIYGHELVKARLQ